DQALAVVERHVGERAHRDRQRGILALLGGVDHHVGHADQLLLDRGRPLLLGHTASFLLARLGRRDPSLAAACGAHYFFPLRAVGFPFARALAVPLCAGRLPRLAMSVAPALGGALPFLVAAPFGDDTVAPASATNVGTSPSTPSGV